MKYWIFISVLIVLVSCNEETIKQKKIAPKVKVGTQTNIECLFDETTFESI